MADNSGDFDAEQAKKDVEKVKRSIEQLGPDGIAKLMEEEPWVPNKLDYHKFRKAMGWD